MDIEEMTTDEYAAYTKGKLDGFNRAIEVIKRIAEEKAESTSSYPHRPQEKDQSTSKPPKLGFTFARLGLALDKFLDELKSEGYL